MGPNRSELDIVEKKSKFSNVFKFFQKKLSDSPRIYKKNTSNKMKKSIPEPKLSYFK